MIEITYRRADGREDSARLRVDPEEAEQELAALLPDATLLDVRVLEPPPRPPDDEEVARRRVKQKFRELLSVYRDVLDERGIDYEGMTYDEMLDAAWPYLPDRGHRLIKELLEDLDDL